jgi:hypothetical protein
VHGLFGIIASGALRLSEVGFLNDRTELTFGFGRMKELLDHEIGIRADSLLEAVATTWTSRPSRPSADYEYFICSLSEKADSISQWQRYGGAGRGYCLGFDVAKLKDAFDDPITLNQMCYHHSAQQERLVSMTNDIRMWMADQAERAEPDQLLRDGADFLAGRLSWVALQCKNPQFEDEREWRLVLERPASGEDDGRFGATPPRIAFTPREDIVAPILYASPKAASGAATPKLPIRDVICGPRLEPELAVLATKRFLSNAGYCDVDVKMSDLHPVWR